MTYYLTVIRQREDTSRVFNTLMRDTYQLTQSTPEHGRAWLRFTGWPVDAVEGKPIVYHINVNDIVETIQWEEE